MWNQPQDETQVLRLKQIDSLKQYFSTVKELAKESLYEIGITLPARKIAITLRINLSRDFPRAPPVIQVFPPVQHRLVDQQMQIVPAAHENLTRWTIHASLGKTVFDIVQKFMQDPPQLLGMNPAPTPMNPYPYTQGPTSAPSTISPSMIPTSINSPANIPTSLGNPNKDPVPPPKSHVALPVIPATFPELDGKSPAELAILLNDDVEFKKFVESLSAVQTMRKVRDDLRDNNELLAKKNLAKEAEIEVLRSDLNAKIAIATEKRSNFEQRAQRQQEILKQFTTPALIEKLSEAASNAESESDGLARKFLAGGMDHKDFIKDFMEKRKLYHLRAAKKESLMMLQR